MFEVSVVPQEVLAKIFKRPTKNYNPLKIKYYPQNYNPYNLFL
ncbi:MAG: hypothetical protein QY308_09500 [Ignavibacteriaceae bacterium]|nr:MAG: hypothetical protein QY308_09500 [Ignavibacteriaceae bacterium]